jgi:hypothetical protein
VGGSAPEGERGTAPEGEPIRPATQARLLHRKRKRGIRWDAPTFFATVVAIVVAIAGIVVAIGVPRNWFSSTPPTPPPVQPQALTATDISAWLGNTKAVGGQVVVLNNLGGPSRTILWIGAARQPDIAMKVSAGAQSSKATHRRVVRASRFPSLPQRSGEAVISYWSLDTCSSGAVPITQDRPYVLLIDPQVGPVNRQLIPPFDLEIPFFDSSIRYAVHLNDGRAIQVAPGTLGSDAASSFKSTLDQIVKRCTGV